MRLFVVTSVYQFLNALTIQLNDPTVKSDIICVTDLLYNTFDLEKLKEEHIFEDVYNWMGDIDKFKMATQNSFDKIKNALKKVGLATQKNRFCKNLPVPGKHYDEVCIGYPDFPTRLACQKLKDKDTVCSILEEGVYTYDFLTRKENPLKIAAFKFFIGEEVVSKSKKLYVYRPDMLKMGEKKYEVVTIRSELDTLGPIIRRIYKNTFPKIDEINKRVIMFDQNMDDTEIVENQCKMANMMMSTFGKENFVIKMHPRTTFIPYDDNLPIYKEKCPFEILMSTIDIEDKILVSIISTASMNPKMILDAEPTIIFTLNFGGYEKIKEKDYFLKTALDFKASYRDPSKVIIPESMEEFERIIKELKGE